MESGVGRGGARRGAGRKQSQPGTYEERITRIKLEKRVYARWCALREHQNFPTNTSVAEYLLDLAETFDQHICQG